MQETTEICALTQDAVAAMLTSRAAKSSAQCRRGHSRWPFPGTVELWTQDQDGDTRYSLATCTDLGPGGVGVRCDSPLAVGTVISIAIHQPEMSLHGQATVRHCTMTESGDFLAGLQFHQEQRANTR